MILSTTPQIEGHTIREYKGIVTGETIIGANMFNAGDDAACSGYGSQRHRRHRYRL